jgi:Mrp family chromosome partitioning ATPase
MAAVSGLIAGRLAGAVMNAAGPRLKKRLVGSDEERAVAAACTSAFESALAAVTPGGDAGIDLIEPQLSAFFSDPEVSGAVVEVALTRRQPDVERLRGRLWSLGFDPSTFPIDVAAFVQALTIDLTTELRKHAARKDSAIFNEVALAELEGLRQQLERLAEGHEDGAGPAGHAPAMPGLMVGRETAISDLKARLGLPAGAHEHGVTQVITAVSGWPGVGKTTIASALAHDPQVAAAFPDGVLWASLTRSERVGSELAAWARAVGVGTHGMSSAVSELSGRLRAALRDKRMLLVLDDVWEAADAEPFRVGGRGCALIVTTRLPEVASTLAPTADDVYRLEILDADSSLELLERLAPTVVGDHPEAARALVGELEGLPLALQVAGHLLEAEAGLGLGVEQLLDDLRNGAALLEAAAPADRTDVFDQTTPTVAALLRHSTDRLESDERERFALLGVFAPKPATFSLDAMAAVWEMEDPVPTIRTLVQRGLLEPVGDRRFRMHALLVLHASTLLED